MTAPVRDHAELLELARRALVSVAIEERRQSIEFAPLRMPTGHHEAATLLSSRARIRFTEALALVQTAARLRFDLSDVVPITATPAEEAAVALAREELSADEISTRLGQDHGMAPAQARELGRRVQGFRPSVARETRLWLADRLPRAETEPERGSIRMMRATKVSGEIVASFSDGSMGIVRGITRGDEVDPKTAGVTLVGPALWSDGSPVKLVWIQLAECGSWKGHPAGPFEMTPATFSEVVRNFEARELPIPWDYEHASEQPATEGSVPQKGSPAPAWVHRLENRGVGGLWGLTEFLDQARGQIQRGEYAFLSPAMRFGCRDSRTGDKIGARLTSVALTNQPFLTGLDGLRTAKDAGGGGAVTVKPTVQERALEIQAAAEKDGKRMTFADAMIEASLQLRPRARTRGRR
ncbi:MAG TPA: phage protease [Polyangiaceae bacterium]|jgi:hypothetical protein